MRGNPLKWHGGKSYLAKRIIGLMPEHRHYVEPYFGGGAVLFRKPCEGISEVVNDTHADLVNFWSVLQTPSDFDDFKRLIEATPFAQAEFRLASFRENQLREHESRVGRAAAFFVRFRQSRQGLGKDFATLSRNRTRGGMNEQVSAWLSAIDGLPEAHERLKRVVILCDDAIKVIKQQDGPNTLFYLDPPYLRETRSAKDCYQHEMTDQQHEDLLMTLYEIKGSFILSGYPHPLYLDIAGKAGWHAEEIEIDNKASSKKTKDTKTECLWMNYTPTTVKA